MTQSIYPLTFGAHLRQTITLGAPIVLAQLALMGQNVIDALLAGRLGADVLAAVAVGASVWGFALVMTIGLQTALSPTIAQLRGANRSSEIPAVARQGLWTALIASVFAVCIMLAGPLLFAHIGVDPQIAQGAREFLHGVIWGAPALALFSGLRNYTEAMGLTRPSLYFSLLGLACLGPIAWVLMFGKFGFPEMRAYGSGVATAIVNWIQALALLWYVARHPVLGFSGQVVRFAAPDAQIIAGLLRLGLPISLAWSMEAGLFQACALLVARFGESWTAAHQVAINVASLTFMVPLGLSMAVTVRVGHALGSGSSVDVRRAAGAGLLIGISTQALACSMMAFGGAFIAGLYLPNDPLVAATAASLLLLAAIFQFPDGIQVLCAGALRGLKDTLVPTICTIIAYWLVAFPLAYYWCFTLGKGVPSLWWGFTVGLSGAALMLGARLYFRLRSLGIITA